MSSYYDQLSIGSLTGATADNHGFLEPTLTDGTWVTNPSPLCDDGAGGVCPAHTSEGGTHDVPGCHYCSSNSATNPITSTYRYDADAYDAACTILKYLQWIGGGTSFSGLYTLNGAGYNNFTTLHTWEIASTSGRTFVLNADSEHDPRQITTFFFGAFTPGEGIEWTSSSGCWGIPGDRIFITGNSTCAGRIMATILSVDYSGLSTPITGTQQWSITVDQDAGFVDTPSDPLDSTLPTCWIGREAFRPELFPYVSDPRDRFFVTTTIESVPDDTYWVSSTGVITIKNGGGSNVQIAFPTADREPTPGTNRATYIVGSFKLEVDYNDGQGYTDITSSLRSYTEDEQFYRWPRIVGTSDGSYTTKIYLGPLDVDGAAQTNLLSGAIGIRIRSGIESASNDRSVAGAHMPNEGHCYEELEDKNGVLGSTGVNGTRINSDGKHYYCNKRASVPKAFLDAFSNSPDHGCWETNCPLFKPPYDPHRMGQANWDLLLISQNETIVQLAPGSSNNSNFTHERIWAPAIFWLMNSSGYYNSSPQYYATAASISSGKYVYVSGSETDVDGNESFVVVKGAILNENYDSYSALDWDTNRWPSGIDGILPTRLGTTYSTLMEYFPSVVSSTYITSGDAQRWIGSRRPMLAVRDARSYGGGLSFTNRSTAGLEGQARVQRMGERYMFIPQIRKSTPGLKQPYLTYGDYATVYGSNQTFYGQTDIRVLVNVIAEGASDFGNKRLGGGTNGQIYSIALDAGLYRIDCSPGLLNSSVSGVQSDSIVPFFTSGNVVHSPYPYYPNYSFYNEYNNKTLGSHDQKAVPGNTLEFLDGNLQGKRFWVKKVSPHAGTDFSTGFTGNLVSETVRVGSYFNMAQFTDDPDQVPLLEVDSIGLQFSPAGSETGAYWDWFSAGSPAYTELRASERETENTEDTSELTNVRFWLDRATGLKFETSSGITIDTIIDAGAPNHPPFITTSTAHGLTSGQRVYITGTNSVPSADFNDVEILVMSTTEFIPLTVNDSWTTNGTQGTVYLVGSADAIVQGSLNLYPSYTLLYYAALATLYTGARLGFSINGSAQTAQTITLAVPQIDLPFTPDTSTLSSWYVFLIDDDREIYQELTYKNTLASEWDLIDGPGFYEWSYSDGKIILHPNTAGCLVYYLYQTSTEIDMGDMPAGIAFPTSLADYTHIKKMDRVWLIDEGGQLAANVGNLAGTQFVVNNKGVLMHPDDDALVVEFAEWQTTTWTVLSSSYYTVISSEGKILINEDGYNLLPDVFCLRIS